jgi:tetratricopeptide (TPR) repeat protein
MGRDVEALASIDEALNINPLCFEALYNRGSLHKLRGRKDLWIADWQAALKANPNHLWRNFMMEEIQKASTKQ